MDLLEAVDRYMDQQPKRFRPRGLILKGAGRQGWSSGVVIPSTRDLPALPRFPADGSENLLSDAVQIPEEFGRPAPYEPLAPLNPRATNPDGTVDWSLIR